MFLNWHRSVQAIAAGIVLSSVAITGCSREDPASAILIMAEEHLEAAYFPKLGHPDEASEAVLLSMVGDEKSAPGDSEGSATDDLYRGSAEVEPVDQDSLIEQLAGATGEEHTTWAEAAGVDPEHLEDYVASLIPVWTAVDMIVAEHQPPDAGMRTVLVIYQKGSSMLVRYDGSPAVAGNSGNPLRPAPDPNDIGITIGDGWDRFSLKDVVATPKPNPARRLEGPTTTSSPRPPQPPWMFPQPLAWTR